MCTMESRMNGNSHPTPASAHNMILVVMGPSACGKSEVATGLANRFRCPYLDGDSFHSKENINKMKNGISLTDEDRIPWLMQLAHEIRKYSNRSTTADADTGTCRVDVVLACSALRKFYRDILRSGNPSGTSGRSASTNSVKVVFVFLDCSKSTLEKRILARKDHFMKVNLLDSQLATLENPCLDGNGEYTATIRVNGDLQLEEILEFTANEVQFQSMYT